MGGVCDPKACALERAKRDIGPSVKFTVSHSSTAKPAVSGRRCVRRLIKGPACGALAQSNTPRQTPGTAFAEEPSTSVVPDCHVTSALQCSSRSTGCRRRSWLHKRSVSQRDLTNAHEVVIYSKLTKPKLLLLFFSAPCFGGRGDFRPRYAGKSPPMTPKNSLPQAWPCQFSAGPDIPRCERRGRGSRGGGGGQTRLGRTP